MRGHERGNIGVLITIGVFVFLGLVIGGMWGCPKYKIYERELAGQAQLQEAKWTRKIAIEESEARLESAKFDSQSEVERARGVAEANQIIGTSLKGNDAYLRYLWIQGLNDGNTETIYIATEAGLPILEAGRRSRLAPNE